MTSEAAPPTVADYLIRRLQPADAPLVVACVRAIYGDSYAIVHKELYDPNELVRLNQSGQLVSIVALTASGEVVGHYGLERPDLGRIAETGEAMVRPEHRHHHLMEQMRTAVIEEARRLGLAGVFGQAVTNHLFSQKMYEHFPSAHPCAVLLGQLPESFHNLPEPPTQRISSLIYFRHLKEPAIVPVHLPARHRVMLTRIYQQFGIEPELADAAAPSGTGQLAVEYNPALQVGLIRVRQGSADTAAQVSQARRELCGQQGAAVVYLQLPLSQASTLMRCDAAEADGFFFAGLFPLFADTGDALRLQYLDAELDISRLQIENAFAQELVAYVAQERGRASAISGARSG